MTKRNLTLLLFVFLDLVIVALNLDFDTSEENKFERQELTQESYLQDRCLIYSEHPEILLEKIRPKKEKECMAIILDIYAKDADENCKTAILDLIMNRVSCLDFPNSIIGVCEQKNQWSGYDKSKIPSKDSYKFVEKYLSNTDKIRNMQIERNMYFLRIANNGIYFRSNLQNFEKECFVSFYST